MEAFRNFFNFSGQFWFIEVLLTLSDKVVILKSTFPLSRAIFLVLSLGFTLPLISVFSFVNRWVINAVRYMVGIFEKQGVTISLNSVLIKLFIKRKIKEIKYTF